MKQITIEKTVNVTKWEASDGTTFETREECSKYEGTAKCVLYTRYKPLIKRSVDEYTLGFGSEVNFVDVVEVKSEGDVNVIKQLWFHWHPSTNHDYRDSQMEKIERAWKNEDILLIARGYEEDNFYIIGTLSEYLDRIKKTVLE